MLALYFAVAGSLAFGVLLFQSARALVRNFAQVRQAGAGSIAASTVYVLTLVAIDTAFLVMLLRALQLTLHPPAAG